MAAQCTGNINDPRVMSHSNLLPVLSAFSAPTTNASSHISDAIREYAFATAFVPELHRLSTRCETLGLSPNISEIIVELYCSVVQLDSKTASRSCLSKSVLCNILAQASQPSSNTFSLESLTN